MKVMIERKIAEDLITTKLQQIETAISDILALWNETSAAVFLSKIQGNYYKGAESDAAKIQELLLEEERFLKMLDDGGLELEKDEKVTISDLWDSDPLITLSFDECEEITVEAQRQLAK